MRISIEVLVCCSLRVNLDMGKTVYSMQIMRDKDIPNTVVRTSTIPEELGRIEYLLSDKTGTLTKNDMELKKLHMGTMSYSAESMDEVAHHLEAVIAKSDDAASDMTSGRRSRMNLTKGRRDMGQRIKDVVQALALCHNVTPVTSDDNNFKTVDLKDLDESFQQTYQASSPDEIAIVRWTEKVGLVLMARETHSITLQAKSTKEKFEFDILAMFPFTSETKRMGVIVRERQAPYDIYFYQKGADSVMSKIVSYNDWLVEECDNMAREGLRTLVVARKKLSEENYQEFEAKYQTAKLSLHDRNEKLQQVISSMLEVELEILGLTGVEDKLQDDVKSTLELLRNAGLKVWMLTGDKVETATCIAISSKLVSRTQPIYVIQHLTDPTEAQCELDLLATHQETALVIDGSSLQLCLDFHRGQFIDIATRLPVVICCRCTPQQKADITTLIKNYTGKRVLAIGDGGNDVSMIQAAHVGVGIVGKEGKQASLAADFSITQFSFLTKLLCKSFSVRAYPQCLIVICSFLLQCGMEGIATSGLPN